MVTFRRLMLWFSLFTGVLAFLVLAGNLSPKEQMIFGASILLLIIFLMGTGGGRKVERIRHRSEAEAEESKSDPEQELPAPVQSEEDASARRDAKLSRSRSGEPDPEPEPEVEEVVVSLADDEVSVTVIEENVHVAEEFVAEIDAESMEEADIESFIDDRRDRHALIRRRIEARRPTNPRHKGHHRIRPRVGAPWRAALPAPYVFVPEQDEHGVPHAQPRGEAARREGGPGPPVQQPVPSREYRPRGLRSSGVEMRLNPHSEVRSAQPLWGR